MATFQSSFMESAYGRMNLSSAEILNGVLKTDKKSPS